MWPSSGQYPTGTPPTEESGPLAENAPLTQCGPVANVHSASADEGLMQHMGQKHGGQMLLEDSVGQLRWLNRQGLCVLRHYQVAALSPMELLRVRHSSPRTSRWGHLPRQTTAQASRRSGQRSGTWAATYSGLAARPPGPTDRDKQLLSELRRAWAMAPLNTPRLGQKAWKEP